MRERERERQRETERDRERQREREREIDRERERATSYPSPRNFHNTECIHFTHFQMVQWKQNRSLLATADTTGDATGDTFR